MASTARKHSELLFWLQDSAGRLGYELDESETAAEFGRSFLAFLQNQATNPKKRVDLESFGLIVPDLIRVYEADQYSLQGVEKSVFEQAVEQWLKIRPSLWRMWLSNLWQRSRPTLKNNLQVK